MYFLQQIYNKIDSVSGTVEELSTTAATSRVNTLKNDFTAAAKRQSSEEADFLDESHTPQMPAAPFSSRSPPRSPCRSPCRSPSRRVDRFLNVLDPMGPKQKKEIVNLPGKAVTGLPEYLKKCGRALGDIPDSLAAMDPPPRSIMRQVVEADGSISQIVKFVEKRKSRPLLDFFYRNIRGGVTPTEGKQRYDAAVDKEVTRFRQLYSVLLNMPEHINVCTVHDVVEYDDNFCIFMQKLDGPEFFNFLVSCEVIPESACKRVVCDILSGLLHLHSYGILHRDLKPENLVFNIEGDAAHGTPGYTYGDSLDASIPRVCLVDFDACLLPDWQDEDLSDVVTRQRIRAGSVVVGTHGYLAPEIYQGELYTAAADIWGLGCILYILLATVPPFSMSVVYDSKSAKAAYTKAAKIVYEGGEAIDFSRAPWSHFPDAKDLCKWMLELDMNSRPGSIEEILDHKWLNPTGAMRNYVEPPPDSPPRRWTVSTPQYSPERTFQGVVQGFASLGI